MVAPPSPRRIGRCVSLRTTRRAVWVPRGGVPECFYGHLRCSLPPGAVLAAPSPTRNVTKGPWVDLGADFVCPGSCPVHLELGSAEPWGRDWFWAPCMDGSWGSGGAAGGPQPSLRGSLCPQACCRQGSAWQLPGGHQAGEGGGGAGQRREATRRGGGEPRCVPRAWGRSPARPRGVTMVREGLRPCPEGCGSCTSLDASLSLSLLGAPAGEEEGLAQGQEEEEDPAQWPQGPRDGLRPFSERAPRADPHAAP